ncbi:hypothetical protein BDV96DRAFT_32066 [Lophiotrema nucula]|uniref:Mid2 domain-containing protein n=1 Tax=Lophiotrema nucula TaxID=690887 RepID=A0A6A5ZBQ9_9PLEO|nr:hypothetical protein BDV96DRAFT_32066 [Lophiotrema nucula]
MVHALPFALLVSVTLATRFAIPGPEETPFVPGYFQKEIPIPQPTSPPQVVRRHLLPRDAATCGWMVADGSPNVCGSSQYCMTTASGEFGVWNCCNPDSCFTQTACSKSVECGGDSPYCVTSYMSNDGTTFSRFMCGTTSSLIYMAYSSEDTPQYTQSLQSVSDASVASVSSASASSASAAAAASRSAASKSVADAASQTGGSPTSSAPPLSTTQPKDDGGVSGGTIAGAVVGVVVGIALLGGIAYFVYRKMNKNKTGAPAELGNSQMPAYTENYKPYPTHEVYAHETNGDYAAVPQVPQELPAENQTHELGPSR